jgi:site-specific recombinase XerD
MLETLCPASHRRYSTLTILGPIVDGFTTWLVHQRYTRSSIKQRIWLLSHIEATLIQRGVHQLSDVDQADLLACRKNLQLRFPYLTGTTDALEKYLRVKELVRVVRAGTTSTIERYLAAYVHYLENVRGSAASTIQQNSYTAAEFLTHLNIEQHPRRLKALTVSDLEAFIKTISNRCSRASLRRIAGRLRSFLQFLAVKGEILQGLDREIDTPRVYREEQLPSALPWETVQAFLNSIDRSGLVGLRDYTMFFLMAIYGLRAGDVAALTLDDIHWRNRKISISQGKTGTVLELPLTDPVGETLHRYLKRIPPPAPFRQVFLRMRAPIGALKTTALSTRFRFWARRSGLDLSARGACHRIRHSYAVFLLRNGTQVKTIGDILGHRTLESTWTYLRLSLEDLRDVSLPVPQESKAWKAVHS